ncbi:MAG TPA: hypothetical protein VIY08_11010 [Candidatus Nitrosocosmicus sp.]
MVNEFNPTNEQLREILVICQNLFNYYNRNPNDNHHNIAQLYEILFANNKIIDIQLYLDYINWLTDQQMISFDENNDLIMNRDLARGLVRRIEWMIHNP